MLEYTEVSAPVQVLIRTGCGLLTLLFLALTAPAARRFFGAEKWGGYAESSWLTNAVMNPISRRLVLLAWSVSALWLVMGRHTVEAAAVMFVLARFFFIQLRWRSVSRGMGAPGFMLYWLTGLVLLLEYTARFDPEGTVREVGILAFKIDVAVIMLCAGQYKLFAGYPQNNGMERGMVNPWWGYFWRVYNRIPPSSIVFKFLNHCAYLGEIVAGALMLIPAFSEVGGWIMILSFAFIGVTIRLGVLCETVIVSHFLFFAPGGFTEPWVARLIPAAPVAPEPLNAVTSVLNPALVVFFWVYIALLPVTKLGLYYNFYAKKRLPEAWQRFQDFWSNLFGIIIWRVFTIDNTNFFVTAYAEDRETGARVQLSHPGSLDPKHGYRFIHVCEFVAFVSVFTTLKYFPSKSPLFRERLVRYARTYDAPAGSRLVFVWTDIAKTPDAFHYVPSREFTLDLEEGTLTETNLADGRSETDDLRFSDLHEGGKVGSYAPPPA